MKKAVCQYISLPAAVELCEAVSKGAGCPKCWASQVHQVCDPETVCCNLHGVLSGTLRPIETSQVSK